MKEYTFINLHQCTPLPLPEIVYIHQNGHNIYESEHSFSYKFACVPSKNSDQAGNLCNLIIVFSVHLKTLWIICYP